MKFALFFSFLFLLVQIHSKAMTEEERDILLKKLTKKVSFDNFFKTKRETSNQKYLKEFHMSYDKEIIDSIIENYNFPQNFNYLENTSCPIVVKDQGYCGCCWSHAATTSLAYRYHKIGVEVDLSPQDALSCYLKDCDAGNFLIDPELNLVINGTVTEGCLPFSSYDGRTIENCPRSCKDGTEYKKYYAQNAYMTEDYLSEDTFYDIVTLMMDQIINYGPIVTGIEVYEDFYELHSDPEKCRNEVYTYDGTSEYLGGHAVVIVGYGFMNSKYYWLLQNSWGEEACDHGFIKVEFGQIGVEQISFVEPYIERGGVTPLNFPLQFDSFDEECNLKVSSVESYDEWKNTLYLEFRNTETRRKFNYQCSAVKILDEKKSVCYYEYWNFWTDKGTYKFNYFQSLGVENTFSLDYFDQRKFEFYGLDELYPIYNDYLYISQEGSKLLFLLFTDDKVPKTPQIYANEKINIPLSDCKYLDFEYYFVACDLKKDEINYFDDMSSMNYNPLVYDILCGYKEPIYAVAYILDKTKYPVFKFRNLVLPEDDTISSESILTGIADIEGSLSGYFSQKNIFYVLALIETLGENITSFAYCEIEKPKRIMRNYLFNCYMDMIPGDEIPYDNIYFYPYYFQDDFDYPYEVLIPETLKGQKPIIFTPKIQVYIESLCPDCVNFIMKSFKEFHEKVQKPNLAEIEFIPFGNANESYNTTTKKYDFSCQHGENECYGNLVETCAIQIQGRIKSYETIICIESNIEKFKLDFDDTLEFCLTSDQITLQNIKDCIKSDMGNFYEHQMAQKTAEHKWVPWIVVNGIHDVEIENKIIY